MLFGVERKLDFKGVCGRNCLDVPELRGIELRGNVEEHPEFEISLHCVLFQSRESLN